MRKQKPTSSLLLISEAYCSKNLDYNQLNTGLSILLRVNGDDDIIFINDEWSGTIPLNNSCTILNDKVLYKNLWEFFVDINVEYIYRKMMSRVRHGHEVRFNFRCDYADSIQLFEMSISSQERGEVLFEVCVIEKDFHPSQDNFKDSATSAEEMLIVCSWCNRINVEKDRWQETEIAVNTLKLFEFPNLPQISHGMCSDCHEKYFKMISR